MGTQRRTGHGGAGFGGLRDRPAYREEGVRRCGDEARTPGLGGVQTVAEAEGRAGEAADKGSAAGPKPHLPLQPLGAAPGFGARR